MITAPKMKTEKDCGLTAAAWVISQIIKRDYELVYKELKSIMEYEDFDLDDNPSEHERIIRLYAKAFPEHNLQFSLVEPIKINLFEGKCPNNRTIILVHDGASENGLIRELFGLFHQHWCILHSVCKETKIVNVWWLNGNLKSFGFDIFEEMLTIAMPQCVYTIGSDTKSIPTPWYSKLYALFINVVQKVLKALKVEN